ncbi:uncharacterized protein NEMAJ01_1065 [Nematocida major]|uniref:uncharacterized protein n=1 Tax=Nematocida major TaxID=1912982 RepID=UPI002007834D|nr:uncharacterized protein NEMAJ01_1065 [Nematocida major]KAH9386169.1 hypothetical protein NEMAJ01_1065 [Nematocida major]
MSQWSRRKASGLPVRNLSLPIFFNGISEEDQITEIREALKNMRYCSLTKTRTINLSCLAIKNLPINSLLAAMKEEVMPLSQSVDYEMVFSETKIVLNVEGNLLESLPLELFSAKNLHAILLRSNKLQTVPPEIGNLKSLCMLTLSGNPIRHLPIEITSLSISMFSICEKHFMSQEEIDRENSRVEFPAETLNELCLKTLPLGDVCRTPSRIKKALRVCYACKSLTSIAGTVYKYMLYREQMIPFYMSVCSSSCKEKCLSDAEEEAPAE